MICYKGLGYIYLKYHLLKTELFFPQVQQCMYSNFYIFFMKAYYILITLFKMEAW